MLIDANTANFRETTFFRSQYLALFPKSASAMLVW